MTERKIFKVTVHEHIIYDSFIEATSLEEAEEIVENQIIEEDNASWRVDLDAGWIETGDIEIVEEEDYDA